MEFNKKYISYSQMWLYFHKPDEWYNRYVKGIQTPPTKPMILGTIYHSAIENPSYDYKSALKRNGFTSDHERMIGEALAYMSQFKAPAAKEKKHYAKIKYPDGEEVTIMIKPDGEDPNKTTEYKTGAVLWTEERVLEAFQFKWYSFVRYLLEKKIPEFELHSFSTKNGKAVTYRVKYTKENFKHIPKIVKVYLDGIKRDIFSVEDFDDDLKTAAMIVK